MNGNLLIKLLLKKGIGTVFDLSVSSLISHFLSYCSGKLLLTQETVLYSICENQNCLIC